MVTLLRFEDLGITFIVMIVITAGEVFLILPELLSGHLHFKEQHIAVGGAAVGGAASCFSQAAPSSSAQHLVLPPHPHRLCRRTQFLLDTFACQLTQKERQIFAKQRLMLRSRQILMMVAIASIKITAWLYSIAVALLCCSCCKL